MTALRLVVGAGLQAANDDVYEYDGWCGACFEDGDYCTCEHGDEEE